MDKIWVQDLAAGQSISVYPHAEFMAECAAYCYDRTYKQFLNAMQARGASPGEAMAALREKLGAVTKGEKRAAWEAKLEGWRHARELKAANKRPVGRPPMGERKPGRSITLEQCKTRIAAVLLSEIVAIEKRYGVPIEATQLFDGMRKQLAVW